MPLCFAFQVAFLEVRASLKAWLDSLVTWFSYPRPSQCLTPWGAVHADIASMTRFCREGAPMQAILRRVHELLTALRDL